MISALDSTYTTERLKLVLDSTRLGMWDWSPKTNAVVFDQNWAEMLGLKVEDLSMTLDDWTSRVHPDDMDSCLSDIQDHMEGKTQFYENIHRMKHADGHWVYILDRGQVVERDANGEAVRFTGTHTDVTDLKHAEFEALLATKSKERFFSNMSHELRAPLHAMLGILEQVQKKDLDDETHKQLVTVTESSQHLLNLVNNLLDASKLKSAEITVKSQAFDLIELLEAAYNLFLSRAQDKGLIFRFDNFLDDNQVVIHSDRSRLFQILINLLSNALKFTKAGEIVLSVSRENCSLRVSIKDTGHGIDDISKIFQPFFSRVNNDENDDLASTGLGLSVTREIVGSLGLELLVDSEPSLGSEFSLMFPGNVIDSASQIDECQIYPSNVHDKSRFRNKWKGKCILAVDDAAVNLTILQYMLSLTGVTLVCVEDVDHALSMLNTSSVDLILTDLHLPVIGGLELTKRIRSKAELSDLPIVVTSADSRLEAWSRCEQAGVTDFIEKPFNESQLLSVLDNYI